MAFNPFHRFRKHQKVIFAILTIVCMFVFVLSFGKGDFFELFNRMGMGGKRPATVASMFGDTVTDQQLGDLREQRKKVNDFVNVVIGASIQEATVSIDRVAPTLGARLPRFKEAHMTWRIWRFQIDEGRMPPMEETRPQFQQDVSLLKELYDQLVRDKKEEDAQHVQSLMRILQINLYRMSPAAAELPMGGSLQAESLLDFLVWKRQADKLDIVLTDADIRAALKRLNLNRDVFEGDASRDAQKAVQIFEQARYGKQFRFTLNDLYQWLREEFRVAMAQSSLLGYEPGIFAALVAGRDVNEVPAPVTPDEFYAYYRDHRTVLKAALLPIPVKSFLTQVKEEPSKKEVERLFREYKDVESNPDRDEPGFKQPRQIKVEWVSGQADSPLYRALAASSVAGVAINPWLAVALVPRLNQEYEQAKFRHRDAYRLPAWTEPSFALSIYTSISHAENVAATVGMAATPGSPLVAAVTYQGTAAARNATALAPIVAMEARERSPLAASFVLAGTQRSPLGVAAIALAVQEHAGKEDRLLSLSAVQRPMMDELMNRFARQLLEANLTTLQTELDKLKNRPKEAAEYVKKSVKDFGLKTGASQELRHEYDIDEEEGLKPLLEPSQKAKRKRLRDLGSEPLKVRVGDAFFMGDTGLYSVRRSIGDAGEEFRSWRIEDRPAKSYPTYDEATPEIRKAVKDAWRLQRGRELARKEAEQVLEQVKKRKAQGDAPRFLRDEATKPGREPLFELEGIARLKEPPLAFLPGRPRDYTPYYAPEDKMAARFDLVDRLLRSLNEIGDATIVWNRPEDIYYVTVLLERREPDEKDFALIFRQAAESDTPAHRLLKRLEQEREREYRRSVLGHLRAEAAPGQVDDQGNWKIDATIRQSIEGRGSDD